MGTLHSFSSSIALGILLEFPSVIMISLPTKTRRDQPHLSATQALAPGEEGGRLLETLGEILRH